MNDINFMKLALDEANKAYLIDEVPVGAIIVKDNEIIATGYNQKEKTNMVTKHAELIAIEDANNKLENWRLNDCTLYVTMLPCPMCASTINQSRIKRIVYGAVPDYADLELIRKILVDKNYGNPVEITGPILNQECSDILKKFFKKKRQ